MNHYSFFSFFPFSSFQLFPLSRVSFCGHRLGNATPESSLPDGAHDLHLGILEHSNDFGKRGTCIGIRIPTAGHDLAKGGWAVRRYNRTDTLVHNRKCRLDSCHVCKGKHASYELPQDNTKAIHIDFLGVRSVLDHLSAYEKQRRATMG